MWQKQPQTLVGSIKQEDIKLKCLHRCQKGWGIGGPLNFSSYVLSLAQLMMSPQYAAGPEIQSRYKIVFKHNKLKLLIQIIILLEMLE